MLNRCVIFGCSNVGSIEKGITLFRIPFINNDDVEAKRRRRLWINFVKKTRNKWTPSTYSSICSAYFTEDSFQRKFSCLPGISRNFVHQLIQDEVGIVSIPSVYPDIKTEYVKTPVRAVGGKTNFVSQTSTKGKICVQFYMTSSYRHFISFVDSSTNKIFLAWIY